MKSIKLTNNEIKLILQGLKDLGNRNLERASDILNEGIGYDFYDKSDTIQKLHEMRGMFKQMLRD